MNNAEKFKQIFGLRAGELWSMRAGDFLAWLNRDVEATQIYHTADVSKKVERTGKPSQDVSDSDLIFRKAAIEALARMMPRSYTPDGSHPADEEIFRAQEVFVDCIEALEILPSAQPATSCSEIPNGSDDTISRQAAIDAIGNLSDEIYGNIEKGATFPPKAWFDGMAQAEHIVRNLPPAQPEVLACGEGELSAYPEQRWIPCGERLPEIGEYVLCYLKGRRYFGQYRVCKYCAADKYVNHPYFDFNENGFPNVVAWMPLPKPYKEGGEQE